MTKSATIVISTTGADTLADAIGSAMLQTHKSLTTLVIIDGPQFAERAQAIIKNYPLAKILQLHENTGASGFYGHRIYGAASFLINTDYVLFLDEDNFFKPQHVASQIDNCEQNQLDWSYSLRSIYDKNGRHLLDDNCECLGKWPVYVNDQNYLVDTSGYCIKRDVAARIAGAWYGGWGQDRQVLATLKQYFPKFDTTGKYTLSYRLDGNPNSVNEEFFIRGNAAMKTKWGAKFPWTK